MTSTYRTYIFFSCFASWSSRLLPLIHPPFHPGDRSACHAYMETDQLKSRPSLIRIGFQATIFSSSETHISAAMWLFLSRSDHLFFLAVVKRYSDSRAECNRERSCTFRTQLSRRTPNCVVLLLPRLFLARVASPLTRHPELGTHQEKGTCRISISLCFPPCF